MAAAATILPNCTSAHTAACRAIVADNPARIAIGIAWDDDTVPAHDTVWQNISGPIVLNGPLTFPAVPMDRPR